MNTFYSCEHTKQHEYCGKTKDEMYCRFCGKES